MKPKQKAEDLINRYYLAIGNRAVAKEAAKICAMELLYFADTQANSPQKGKYVSVDWIKYLNEVIKHLNK